MQCLSTCSLIKELLFTSGSVYDKDSSQVPSFGPRGRFFSPSQPSSHQNSPHKTVVPEAKVLTGLEEWGGRIKRVPFNTLGGGQKRLLTYNSSLSGSHLSLFWETSSIIHFLSFHCIHGFEALSSAMKISFLEPKNFIGFISYLISPSGIISRLFSFYF